MTAERRSRTPSHSYLDAPLRQSETSAEQSLSAGCGDGNDRTSVPLDDVERGTIASTRWEACGVEGWGPLTVSESLWRDGLVRSVQRRGRLVLAAENCEEVDRCSRLFHADDQLELRPECGSEPTDQCEGNVAKYCSTDDDFTWYEFSYDCAMAGATCIEGVDANGVRWSDCQAPLDPATVTRHLTAMAPRP